MKYKKIFVIAFLMLGILTLSFVINGCKNDNTISLENMVLDRNLGATDGQVAFSGYVYTMVGSDKVPVMNAKVIISSGVTKKTSYTDKNGYFNFKTPLDEMQDYTLNIEAEGFNDFKDSFNLKDKKSLSYILSPAITDAAKKGAIIGKIDTNDNTYLDNNDITVEVWVEGSLNTTVHPNDNGVFITNMTKECSILVKAKGKKEETVTLSDMSGSLIYTNLNFSLVPDYMTSTLQILDYDTAKPINDVKVTLYYDGKSLGTYYSDSDGIILLDKLENKSYTLIFEKSGYYDSTEGLDPSSENLKIVKLTQKRATLTGKVTDSATNIGIEGATVQLENGLQTKTDANGEYTLYNIPPETHTIYFQKSNYDTVYFKLDFSANENKTLDVNMYNSNPNSSISGDLYTFVNSRYAFLNVKNKELLSFELFKKVGDNLLPVELNSNNLTISSYNFQITSLTSGIYALRVTYIETSGDSNQPNGKYIYNSDLSETITLEEGKALDKPLILETQ